ncbi:tetratricopeptide repeat-containing sensor histidine kinase [Filimonas effusa]|uniref:histidine kinase n=1 Tax=Filimonas effusa TaxID=2508721 RepID=A0A4Q1DDD4_9BACT|nr:ATP-binding protein [Filimonas effusa]RXK86885.1 hypothetical protein ESB13_08875 [Filimonas effusa]
MKYLCKLAVAIVSVIFIGTAFAHAQQTVRLPVNLKQRLIAVCDVCQHKPGSNTGYRQGLHHSIEALLSGELDSAYTHALYAITQTDTGSDGSGRQYAYFIKAKVLYYKKLYTQAIAEYKQLLGNAQLDTIIRSNIYTNLGECYLELSDFKQALHYFDSWKQTFQKYNDLYSASAVYQNSGLCLFHMERYAEAENDFKQTLTVNEQLRDTFGLAMNYMNLANLYYNQYLDSKAIPCFEKSLLFAKRAGDLEALKSAYLNMAVVEENRNRFKEALQYRKQYETLHDSAWNRDNIWKLASQEKKFTAQIKENKIHLLEQQALVSNAQLKTQRWQRNTLLAVAIGFLAIAGFSLVAYTITRRKNKIIVEQKDALDLLNKTKDRLYSIVAHDLRSPIYSLKTNLAKIKTALSKGVMSETNEVLANAQHIAGNTYALLDNLLNWTLSQTNQLLFHPQRLQLQAIVQQVYFDYQPIAANKQIELQQSVPPGYFIKADLNSMKIVLRNLLDNAIKYTPAGGRVSITATGNSTQCSLQIEDTGIGMDEQLLAGLQTEGETGVQQDADGNTSTGFGLNLCRVMVQKNNGSLHISSKKNAGTQVDLLFPLNDDV